MKIIVISTAVFKLGTNGLAGYGGLEHIAWQCAAGLAAKGHSVALVAPEGSICPGCEIISAGPAGHSDERGSYGLYWAKLPWADVVIDHSWCKWAYILKSEGRLKAPILGVMHAPVNSMYAELPPVDRPCMVCISDDQRAHFEGLFGRPARTCHNGVDTEYYNHDGSPRTDRFLFLARFSTIKGPDLAIEACKAAGVGLDLVGDTSITNEPELFNKCKAMCDGQQIRMVGPASRSECVHWLSQARALLHPNQRFREPFGLAPVEAMLCGCPVVAWDYGAMRETVNPQAGILVRSMDELVTAIKTVQGFDTRRHALRFGVEHMVNRYELLCKEALEGGW